MIQRCLVHAQRVIRRYTTARPRTDAGKAIYALALKLTRITTVHQALDWTLRLHDFGQVFNAFLNEKTPVPKERRTLNNQWECTHLRVRKAYNSLLHLSRKGWLFTYLQPPPNALEPQRWASTTNSLEGGINAQLKRIADAHRGISGERQRRMLEWYLHSKTQLPDDPIKSPGSAISAKINSPKSTILSKKTTTKPTRKQADQPSTTTLSQPSTNTR